MKLSDPIESVKGVGPAVAAKMAVVGIKTIQDLIENYPRRYEDYSKIDEITALKPGTVTIKAKIKQAKGRHVRRGMHITEAVASDDSGSVRLVWFNQPYREAAIKHDQEYFIRGNFGLSYRRLSIQSPSMELVSDFPLNAARIVPIYRLTKGLKALQISKAVRELVPSIRQLSENLPEWIVKEQKLLSHSEAVEGVHFPSSERVLAESQRRLGFEEVFCLTLAALLNKHENQKDKGLKISFDEQLAQRFVAALPFDLTDSQKRTVWQVYKDFEGKFPMNRLIEGDVGSGKTVVACMAALMAMNQNMQAALMAPTEILANQHAQSLRELLKPIGLDDQVILLTGSIKGSKRQEFTKKAKSNSAKFIVGTHALIEENIDLHSLALVIIDEQHRFGVEQRKKLQTKAGHMPHVLSLTATPIPRSLALTLYGELDISVLKEKPVGRKEILTKIVSPNSRTDMEGNMLSEIQAGRQVFVVCPLITDSEVSDKSSAENVHKKLAAKFKGHKVALLHGRMKPVEKNNIMQDFVDCKINILVSTTVIEVGVDVPNASIMVIESADHFGLAQMHQLRGRVGRGDQQSYCYLVLSDSKPASRRLRALESSNNGFELAELDLEIRGPGAIYGTSQHGELDLRIAKLSDVELISNARHTAAEFIERGENLLNYNELNQKVTDLRKVTNLN